VPRTARRAAGAATARAAGGADAAGARAQISTEELQTAMGFLREQLGEDELRALLGDLNAWSDDGASPIPVGKLMELAAKAVPADGVPAKAKAIAKAA
jgi:hypothetical protein